MTSPALDVLLGPLDAVLRLLLAPTSRTFWPYLAVSLCVAAWLARQERRRGVTLPPRLDAFSRFTWLGTSAVNDYLLVVANTVLVAALVAPWLPAPADAAAAVAGAIARAAASPGIGASPWLGIALAATLFVADDFVRWLLHRLEHRVPALWELHKVHHSAEALNFVTAERHHPLSAVYYALGLGATAALVNGAFVWAADGSIRPATLLGANAFWFVGNLLASSLRHSPAWLSFGPRVERWLLSPAQHQVHHSEDPRHFDANLGSTLAIWDRWAGSLITTTREREPLSFGLGAETPRLRTFRGLLVEPLRGIASARGRVAVSAS